MIQTQRSEKLSGSNYKNIAKCVAGLNRRISGVKWYTVFNPRRAQKFLRAWNFIPGLKGGVHAYELVIATRAYSCGCTDEQVVTLLREWRRKHRIAGDWETTLQKILPKARKSAQPSIDRYNAKQQAKKEAGRRNGGLKKAVLALVAEIGPATSHDLSIALGKPAKTIAKAMERAAKKGELTGLGGGLYGRAGMTTATAVVSSDPHAVKDTYSYQAAEREYDEICEVLSGWHKDALFAEDWKSAREMNSLIETMWDLDAAGYMQDRGWIWHYCAGRGWDLANAVAWLQYDRMLNGCLRAELAA